MVEHERFDGEKTTTQRRYYTSSLAPEAVVRRLALNLLMQEPISSVGIKNRRLRAG
jgi:hypothetical protein